MGGEGIPQIISMLQMAEYKNIKFSKFCCNKICIKMNALSWEDNLEKGLYLPGVVALAVYADCKEVFLSKCSLFGTQDLQCMGSME